MIICAKCFKEIRGKMKIKYPPKIKVALGIDKAKPFHPKCYDAAEREAAKEPGKELSMIKVRYSAIDGYSKSKTFKTLAGARKFAVSCVGANPTASKAFGYAVSDDGIGKITASIPLPTLFGVDLFGETF